MELKKRSKKDAAQYQKVRFVSPQVSDQQYYQASPESVHEFYQKPVKKKQKQVIYQEEESDEEPQYYQTQPRGQILYQQPIQQVPVQSTRVQRGQDFDRWNSVYKRQEMQTQQYLQRARPIEKKKRKKKVIIVEEEEEESEQEEEEIIVKKVPKKRKEPRVLEPRQQLLLKEQETRERQRSKSAQRYPSRHMAPIYEDQEESEQEYRPSRKTVKPINFEPLFVQKKEGIKWEEDQWEVKATKEGFLQFHLKNSRTFQYEFPTFFDQKTKKTRHMFVHNWQKKRDSMGTKFYQHKKTGHKQYEKPYKPTYLIAAAQTNNLAFLELYLKVRGSLQITDQTGRTALHHAVGNGNKEFSTLICEFSWRDQQIIEGLDNSGNSPLFVAVRYDQVECIKVLISYGADLFQKGKLGNTLMHQAAFYNASNAAVLISTYSGSELLRVRNHEGYRPIDISRLKQNQEMTDALQKLERNLTISDALLEREAKQFISQPSKLKEPFQKGKGKKRQVILEQESDTEEENNPLSVLKIKEEQIYGRKKARIVESDASSQEDQDQVNLQEARFKQQALHDQRKLEIMREHEREFKLKAQKDKKKEKRELREQKQEELVGPSFKKYNTQRDQYKIEKKQKYKKGQIVPFDESSDPQFESQKKRRSIARDKSQEYQKQQFEKSKSYINLELNPDDSQNRSRRQQPSRILQELQDSQFDMTRDYEAQRIVRVKSRGRSKSQRESQVPQVVSNFFGMVSTNFNKFKDFMWQDPNKRSSSSDESHSKKTKRSKSSIRDTDFLSADDSFEFQRKQQEQIRHNRKKKVVYARQQPEQTEEDETFFEDSRAEYILPQNRSKKSLTRISEEPSSYQDKSTARKENSLIMKFDEEQEYEARRSKEKQEETILEESQVTDSHIVNSRRGKKKKKKKKQVVQKREDSEASKKSIGVGSNKIDETLLGSSNLSQTRSFNKQLKAQRLAEKGQQILQRKTYMSSEEEKKGETYIRMRSPSPGPQFMKEEVGYLQATELEQKPVEQFIKEQEERQAIQLQQIQRTPTARYQISSQDKMQRSSGDQRNIISASRGETNNQQQDSSKSHHTQISQRGSEMKAGEKKDIKKFYEDLVGDQTTLVQDQIQPLQANKNAEETQDISQIYNRVMKGVTLDISGEIKNDSTQEIILRNSVDSSTHDQFFSFLGDLQKDKELSKLSFIEEEAFQSQSKFQQSNFLDKGQYLQQSQNLQKSLVQNSSMTKVGNKMFFQGGNNNSMLNFQYQSDNEKQNSPGKKQPKIPPRQISNLKESADKQKALQILFNSDEELVQNLESQKSQQKQKTPLLLPVAPSSTFSQKTVTQSQNLQETDRNLIQTSSSGKEEMKKSSDFVGMKKEEEEEEEKEGKKQGSEMSSKKKTNNRYEQEESLIQFDISNTQNQIPILHSKIEEEYTIMSSESNQTDQSVHLEADKSILGDQAWQEEEHQLEAEGFLSKKGLLGGILGSAFAGTATGNKIKQNRNKLDKYGAQSQTQVTQKRIGVGSKVEKQEISQEKLQSILADDLEFLSDSELVEKSPRQQLKQEQLRASSTSSLKNNLLTQSQEGVLDDLMDISRDKFKPLEVVQEESRTIQDITYDNQTPKTSFQGEEEEAKVTQIFSQPATQEQDSKKSAMRISSRYEQEEADDQVIQTSMEFSRVPKMDQMKRAELPLTQDELSQRKCSPHPSLLKRQEEQVQSNALNSSRGSGKKPGSAGETSQQNIQPITISPLKSAKAANSALQARGFFKSGNESEEEKVHDGLAPNLAAWQQQFIQNRSVLQQHLYTQSNSEDESGRRNPLFSGTKMRVRIPKNPLAQSTLPPTKNYSLNQGVKKSVKDVTYKPKETQDGKTSNISQMSSASDKMKNNFLAFTKNKLGLNRKNTEVKEEKKIPEEKKQKKAFGSQGANSKGSAKGSSGDVEMIQLQGSQDEEHSIGLYPPKRKRKL